MNKKLNAWIVITSLIVFTSGCVSASKHKELQDEEAQTQAKLAACELKTADLERQLGITSSQKTDLEGSVADMKKALSELEARRAETEKRLAEFKQLTAKFQKLVDAGKLTIKVRNGRMMIALSTDILFSSGSAKLSAAGATAIQEVTTLLKDLNNRNFQVEGHTDNVPIKTKMFPSNWELASARAISVLDTMLAAGMPAEHMSSASYGSYDPIADNGTPEGRSENRRIAIVIVPDLSGLPGFDELNRMSSSGTSTPAPSSTPSAIASPAPSAAPTDTK